METNMSVYFMLVKKTNNELQSILISQTVLYKAEKNGITKRKFIFHEINRSYSRCFKNSDTLKK